MSGIYCLNRFNSVLIVLCTTLATSFRNFAINTKHCMMAPYCNICSFRQVEGQLRPLYHLHNSAREVRIMAGVEYNSNYYGNPEYLCPTCMCMHTSVFNHGLNVCLSDSQLHNFHLPRDPHVVCPPDPFHIDWMTISGGTISDITHGFQVDYRKEVRPMRVFVAAGLNDLMRRASRDSIVERFIHLKETLDAQNVYHPHAKNELVIATILNPPKLVWFQANGPPPANHVNHLSVLKELNDWIKYYNRENGRVTTPAFHRFGVRTVKGKQSHHLSQWRQSEPVHDMVHLSDAMRVRMGQAFIKHFSGEYDRFGALN